MNKQIAVYDNTVSARTYISYIAEQAGGFACVGRDGKLYIKNIGQDTQELPLKYFKNFKWGDKFKISRIRYEDGIQVFEKGNNTQNTVYISQDNMYIVDQGQIDNIYNLYENFEAYSFEGDSVIDPALDVGDILIIDSKRVIYQGFSDYSGKFIASISSKIQSKEKEETTVRTPSQKTINRRVQSSINEINGEITQLVEEQTDFDYRLTQTTQDINSIKSQVEEVTDYKREVEGATQIHLEEAGEQTLLKLEIKGNVEYNNYLYPSEDVFPSNDLFPNMEGSELI